MRCRRGFGTGDKMCKAMANSKPSQAVNDLLTENIICFIMTNQSTNFLKRNFL